VEEVVPVTIRYDFEASHKLVELLQTFNNVYGAGFVRESLRAVGQISTRETLWGSGGIVARAYASLLNDMWSGEYCTLAPSILKTTVAQFAPQFNNCLQHDSQEFCSFLMDGCFFRDC